MSIASAIRRVAPFRGVAARVLAWGPGASLRASLAWVLVLAVGLRLWLVDAQSIWYDEAFSLWGARNSASFIVRSLAHHDMHPPGYYLLLHWWLQLSGFGVVQARLLSTLLGLCAIPLLYWLARALFDRATAICAALLLAVSPAACWYADEIRMYTLAPLCALGAVALLVQARRTGLRRFWVCFILVAVCSLYADYSSAYLLSGALLWYVLAAGWQFRALLPLGCAALAIVALSVPVVQMARAQVRQHLDFIDYILAPTPGSVGQLLLDLVSQHAPLLGLVAVVSLLLLALAAGAAARDLREPSGRADRRESYLLLVCLTAAPLLIPLGISLFHPVLLLRTALCALFGLLILAARGIVAALRGPRPAVGWAALGALLALNACSLWTVHTTPLKEDWRAVTAYLRAHSTERTLLVVSPGWQVLSLTTAEHFAGWRHPVYASDWPQAIARESAAADAAWLAIGPKALARLAGGPPVRWPTASFRLAEQQRFAGIVLLHYVHAP